MGSPAFIFVLRRPTDDHSFELALGARDPRQLWGHDLIVVRRFEDGPAGMASVLHLLEAQGIVPTSDLVFSCEPYKLVDTVIDAATALATAPDDDAPKEPRVRVAGFLGLSTEQAERVILTEMRESISPRQLAAFIEGSSATATDPDQRFLEAVEAVLRQVAEGVSESRVDDILHDSGITNEILIAEVRMNPSYTHLSDSQLLPLIKAGLRLAVIKGMLGSDPSLLQQLVASIASQLETHRALGSTAPSFPRWGEEAEAADSSDLDDDDVEQDSEDRDELAKLVDRADEAYYGLGDEIQDYEKARELFEQAASRGSAQAMRMLGAMYEDGEGCKKSLSKATKYYRAASDLGDCEAWGKLALLYGNEDPDEGLAQPDNARKCWDRFFSTAEPATLSAWPSFACQYVKQAHHHEWPRQHQSCIRSHEATIRAWVDRIHERMATSPYAADIIRDHEGSYSSAMRWYLDRPIGGIALESHRSGSAGPGSEVPRGRFASLTPSARERIFRCLCRMVHCDGRVDPREQARLSALQRDFGLSESTAARLEREANIQGLQIGSGTEERAVLVDCMVEMAYVDGQLDPREYNLLMKIANAVGLDRAQLEERLRRM